MSGNQSPSSEANATDADESQTPFREDAEIESETNDSDAGGFLDPPERGDVFDQKEQLEEGYTPTQDQILHRDEQLNKLQTRFQKIALEGELPDVMMLDGPNGTGKTLLAKHAAKQTVKEAPKYIDDDIEMFVINCTSCTTQYQTMVKVANKIFPQHKQLPPTGYDEAAVTDKMFEAIEQADAKYILLILDEVGQVSNLDNIFYQIVRSDHDGTMLDSTDVGLIITGNSLRFYNNMEGAVYSSMSNTADDVIQFPKYDAVELKDILERRAFYAFKDDALEENTVQLAAAYASKQGGDARYGLQILKEAGKIVEEECGSVVTEEHIEQAQTRIERNRVRKALKNISDKKQLILAVLVIDEYRGIRDRQEGLIGTEIEDIHATLASKLGITPYNDYKIYTPLRDEFYTRGIVKQSNLGRSNAWTLNYAPERYLEVMSDAIVDLLFEEHLTPDDLNDPHELNR